MRIRNCLALVVVLAGCYEKPIQGPAEANGATFQATPEALPADGASMATLFVSIPENAAQAARSVTFTASNGTLLGGQNNSVTVEAGPDNVAVAELRAPTIESVARILARVGGAVLEDSVVFITARASRIDLDAPRFTLSAGLRNEITVTATLRRGSGRVTPGQLVTFVAELPNGTEFGQFSAAAPSNADGIVTVRFTAGETGYRGPFIIRASTLGDAGPVHGELVLHLTE